MKGDKVVQLLEIYTYGFLFCFRGHNNWEVNKYVLIEVFYRSASRFFIDIIHKEWGFEILKKILIIYLCLILNFYIKHSSI